ncbi:hypothetical protein J6590_005694 [Homalodisca vitripennis]|nr:hypothetical protein J6590_005694 [Homalodisca vitripennis]
MIATQSLQTLRILGLYVSIMITTQSLQTLRVLGLYISITVTHSTVSLNITSPGTVRFHHDHNTVSPNITSHGTVHFHQVTHSTVAPNITSPGTVRFHHGHSQQSLQTLRFLGLYISITVTHNSLSKHYESWDCTFPSRSLTTVCPNITSPGTIHFHHDPVKQIESRERFVAELRRRYLDRMIVAGGGATL